MVGQEGGRGALAMFSGDGQRLVDGSGKGSVGAVSSHGRHSAEAAIDQDEAAQKCHILHPVLLEDPEIDRATMQVSSGRIFQRIHYLAYKNQ